MSQPRNQLKGGWTDRAGPPPDASGIEKSGNSRGSPSARKVELPLEWSKVDSHPSAKKLSIPPPLREKEYQDCGDTKVCRGRFWTIASRIE